MLDPLKGGIFHPSKYRNLIYQQVVCTYYCEMREATFSEHIRMFMLADVIICMR